MSSCPGRAVLLWPASPLPIQRRIGREIRVGDKRDGDGERWREGTCRALALAAPRPHALGLGLPLQLRVPTRKERKIEQGEIERLSEVLSEFE